MIIFEKDFKKRKGYADPRGLGFPDNIANHTLKISLTKAACYYSQTRL